MITKLADDYEIPDQYHSQPRNIKIIHVGAGASGLLLAYKAQRQLHNYELICYEKYVGEKDSDLNALVSEGHVDVSS